jgi:hypothetical protein
MLILAAIDGVAQWLNARIRVNGRAELLLNHGGLSYVDVQVLPVVRYEQYVPYVLYDVTDDTILDQQRGDVMQPV